MSLKNQAHATRVNYIRGVRDLMLNLGKLPENCTVDELKAYLVRQRDELNYSSSTVNLRVCGLKYYFREVIHRPDLVVNIPNPRLQKYDTEVLNFAELLRMRSSCRDMRQLLVLHLLYDTGLRVRELCRLRVSDFDKHQRTIRIRNSKGNKMRTVFYGDELCSILNRYVKARGGVPADTILESYVDKGKPLSVRGIQHIVRQIVRRAGIKKRVSPHTLRHTFAVHYLDAGGTLTDLQKLLGHANLTTTLHYLKYAQLPENRRVSVLDELMRRTGKTGK